MTEMTDEESCDDCGKSLRNTVTRQEHGHVLCPLCFTMMLDLRVENTASWSVFARGHWTMEMPNREGWYMTCDRAGHHAPNRFLTVRDGLLVDAHNLGSYDPKKVLKEGSEWKGYWWSRPIPELPAPIGTEGAKHQRKKRARSKARLREKEQA